MNDYAVVTEYIENYWDLCTFQSNHRTNLVKGTYLQRLGRFLLPNQVVSPNDSYFAGSQYYWDTYFTILGLLDSGRGELAKGMVDNLAYLYHHFGLIIARNTIFSVGRTQPPFLTSMIWEIYEAGAADDVWLDKLMELAADEYEKVWNSSQRQEPESCLNRYQPRYLSKHLAIYESGWDASTRYSGNGAQVLPVDLNCLLFKYELDLYRYANLRGKHADAKKWQSYNKRRHLAINQYFWQEQNGFFYDYELTVNKSCSLHTLAGYYALWAKVATPRQAELCRKKLKVFENLHGLASTEKITWDHKQWDYPNGWPPLHYIAIKGLRNYGFDTDADRLSVKWLDLNANVFQSTGRLWEKYDVTRGDIGRTGRYETQPGFAWTNSIFLRLNNDLRSRL